MIPLHQLLVNYSSSEKTGSITFKPEKKMKHVKKTLLLFFLPTLLSLAGCNNDDVPNLNGMTEQEIQALFVGEWQEIERGNDTHTELATDGHTIEFLPDSIYLTSWNNDLRMRYSLDSEFLYLNSGKMPDGHTYRHTFIGSRDKLRLDHVDGLTTDLGGAPSFYIYKRIK
jgi:hypothetical protein